jgi:hypothetical protein
VSPYEILLAGLGLTGLMAVAVAGYLDRPMWRLLVAGCGGKTPARFWSACGRVLLVVTPVALHLIVCPAVPDRSGDDWLPELLDRAKWGLVGEVAAVLMVGTLVAIVTGGRVSPVYVDIDDADDLRRLVDRVRVLRARELLERLDRDGR